MRLTNDLVFRDELLALWRQTMLNAPSEMRLRLHAESQRILPLERDLANEFPSADNCAYVEFMEEKARIAFEIYTDPFGVKTYA